MRLETQRLVLYTVSNDEMKNIIEKQDDIELKKAYGEMLTGCIEHPTQRDFYAVWHIERKDDGKIVGDLSFKGIGEDKSVEIGYGLYDGFCGKGYMCEAVVAVSKWALSQNGVERVEAEAEESNERSIRVLMNAGFIKNGKTGDEGPRFEFVKG